MGNVGQECKLLIGGAFCFALCVFEPLDELFLGGDIPFDRHESEHSAVRIADGQAVDLECERPADLAVFDDLAGVGFAVLDSVFHAFDLGWIGFGSEEEVPRCAAFDFVECVAGECCEGIVDPFDAALRVGDDDAVFCAFCDHGQHFCFGCVLDRLLMRSREQLVHGHVSLECDEAVETSSFVDGGVDL